ncbi:MAG TPA: phytanoyl-CoA dioxygenase family protein [Burkholderiales bacterium]
MSSLLRRWRDAGYLLAGLLAHFLGKSTPPFAYQALIRSFCRTGGLTNDRLSSLIARLHPPVELGPATGVLGHLSRAQVDGIVRSLKADGYYVCPQRLSAGVCARLVAFAKTTPCLIRTTEDEDSNRQSPRQAVYDPLRPQGIRYDFTQEQVVNIPEVQALLADFSVLSVAQAYLGSLPLADVASMWWHTAYSDQPDAKAAQFFHFDMDRIRWLKIFIYLTDVGPDNGPHCFVRGSHRSGQIPPALLSRGYVRLADEDVLRHYPAQRLIEFHAPAGTILFEDTRGLHKGKAVRSGDRLMLQMQFSNSLFGGAYPPTVFRSLTPELERAAAKYPAIYKNYLPPRHIAA